MEDEIPECECGSKNFVYDDTTGDFICRKCSLINDDYNSDYDNFNELRSNLTVGESTASDVLTEIAGQRINIKPQSRTSGETKEYRKSITINQANQIMDKLDIVKTSFRTDVISIINICFKKKYFSGVDIELTILAIIRGVSVRDYKKFQKNILDNTDGDEFIKSIESSSDYMTSLIDDGYTNDMTKDESEKLIARMSQDVKNMKELKDFELASIADEGTIHNNIIKKMEEYFVYPLEKIDSRINFLTQKDIFERPVGVVTWYESDNFSKFDKKYEDVTRKILEFYKKISQENEMAENDIKIKKINDAIPYYALAVSAASRKSKNTGMTCATLFYLLKEHDEYIISEFDISQNDFISFWGIGKKQFGKNLSILRGLVFLKDSHLEFLGKLNSI